MEKKDLTPGENKPNQSQSKLAPSTAGGYCWGLKKQNQCRPSAGNPKSEYLNPKQVEWMLFEKTKPIWNQRK